MTSVGSTLRPPAQGCLSARLLLQRLGHSVFYIGLRVATTATSKIHTGRQHRLGDHGSVIAPIKGHLPRDHTVEMLWLRIWEGLLEFLRQYTIFLHRVEVHQWSPGPMGRGLKGEIFLGCGLTH